MAKGGDFDWQQAAMDEQAEAANVPGHLNINFNMNIDYTPGVGGNSDLAGIVGMLENLIGGNQTQ
ncbi:Hypothetical protein, putative [Bodo saltans]|uniref:Uncharacterized protein n=1 Tax=Bodo saltans TaxID=75058 RepID=A0A0S4J6L2_BODSA|nr:Hypothetical protein, putative [Bodo saltans]|eukprot:CUG85210.1 Hypothetical protein, putative [Bodo saltans]